MKTLFPAIGRCLRPLGAASIAALALAGCATTSPRSRADAALAGQFGASPAVVAKLEKNQPLDLVDIVALKSLPDDVLIRRLRATGTIYVLTTAQVDRLRELGVSTAVIDTLLLSGSISYPRVRYYGYYSYGYPSYYYGGFGRFGHFGGYGFSRFGHHGGHH